MAEIRLADHRVQEVVAPHGEVRVPEGVALLGAPLLWKDTKGAGQVVAILDTGCDIDHPDLKDWVIGGRNFTPDYGADPNNFRDNHYHGTHVAGTIAANGRLLGVAPEAHLLICKVLTGQGAGDTEWIARAVRWVADWRGPRGERAAAINMSLGGPGYDTTFHQAVKYATEQGVLVVCAAGNEGDGNPATPEIAYPANFPESTAVGAVDIMGGTASFSNSNPEVDVAAPGVHVYSCYPGGRYAYLDGTSMATPHATGFAVLTAAKFAARLGRRPTEPELYYLVKYQTVDVDAAGLDADTGAGLVSFTPQLAHPRSLRRGDGALEAIRALFSHEIEGFGAEAEEHPIHRAAGEEDLGATGPQQFIAALRGPALEVDARTGVPAGYQIARAALETGWGRYVPVDLATGRYSYNLFGVKAVEGQEYVTAWTWEYRNGRSVRVQARFRAYKGYQESLGDHGRLLLTRRYRDCLALAADQVAYAGCVNGAGYSTDPAATNKLASIMRTRGLLDLRASGREVTRECRIVVEGPGGTRELSGEVLADDRAWAPVRELAEAMGAVDVAWDGGTRTVTVRM